MMNKTIKELAEFHSINVDVMQAIYDDITLLIVQECVGVVEGGRFLHDQAPTALFAKECSSAIKRHFGVE